MRKRNPRSSDEDFFKYSILISLHYYDINFHSERISKLKPFESEYNFIHTTLNDLKWIILIFHEQYLMKIIKYYICQKMIALNKAQKAKLKNNRYAAIKPLKNKFIKLIKSLESLSHIELTEYLQQYILKNKIENN